MDVNKIQRLSEQHKLLKDFHAACNYNDAQLTIEKTPPISGGDITLDYASTKLIISDVRVSLLRKMKELEEAITKEIH